jgi:broad specificity phosphatase PhoE/GNAT superfamily N-acetyltransferase
MIIRAARTSDHPSIAALWRESALLMEGTDGNVPSAKTLLGRLREADWDMVVLSDHRGLAGFAAFATERGILHQLFIRPSAWGSGFGTRLLQTAMAAMPEGFTLRVLASNLKAQRFYAGSGLRSLGLDIHAASGVAVLHYAWTPISRPDRQIYLVRHGETEWNVAGRYQGWRDSALTDRGIAQAKAMGRRLASLTGGSCPIHASPLGRVRETCDHIRQYGSWPEPIWDERLAEVTLGAWDGLLDIDIDEGWPGALEGASPFDWYFRSPDGERYATVAVRVGDWLADMKETVVAVSHGLVGRILRGEYLGLEREQVLALPVDQNIIWRLADGHVTAFRA